jgi:hypothetical protein
MRSTASVRLREKPEGESVWSTEVDGNGGCRFDEVADQYIHYYWHFKRIKLDCQVGDCPHGGTLTKLSITNVFVLISGVWDI